MDIPPSNAGPEPGFKFSYEPNLAAGGAMGAVMAILVYYKVLDVEAAGLWAVVIAAVAPVVQGAVVRIFTYSTAKIRDAGIPHSEIERKAKATRRARHASKQERS